MRFTMTRALIFSVSVIAAIGTGALSGCGSEQATTGTQVEVTDVMQREAEASAKYFEEQSRPGKSAPRKNPDAVEPGAP